MIHRISRIMTEGLPSGLDQAAGGSGKPQLVAESFTSVYRFSLQPSGENLRPQSISRSGPPKPRGAPRGGAR